MTPGARIAAAITCLDQILGGDPAERVLTNWARSSRFAGSKDRAAIRDHVFGALRRRNSLAALGGAMTGRGIMIGAVRRAGEDVDALFNGAGHAPAPLTEAERAHVPGAAMPWDMPDWVVDRIAADHGTERARDINDLFGERAPICLRVRLGAGTVADAARDLADEGITAQPVDGVPTALRVTAGERRIKISPVYLDGRVELQDSGAQSLCAALPVPAGARVLDYCAGGGGKILALCDRVEIRAFAHDADPKRMGDLPDRATRAQARVRVLTPDQLTGLYDVVLCDVPCSGSGTWRRTPEAKWRFTPDDLTQLEQVQAQILVDAAGLVAPGGVLAYATCSVLSVENHDQVARFVAQNPDWAVIGDDLRFPDVAGDGFYSAILQRTGAR